MIFGTQNTLNYMKREATRFSSGRLQRILRFLREKKTESFSVEYADRVFSEFAPAKGKFSYFCAHNEKHQKFLHHSAHRPW